MSISKYQDSSRANASSSGGTSSRPGAGADTSPYIIQSESNGTAPPYNFSTSSETLIHDSSYSSPVLNEKRPPRRQDHLAINTGLSLPYTDAAPGSTSPGLNSPVIDSSAGGRYTNKRRGIVSYLRSTVLGRYYVAATVVAVVLLVSILSISTPVSKSIDTIKNTSIGVSSAIKDTVSSFGKTKSGSTCNDAFSMPGYIWYGKKHQDVRWFPYSHLDEESIGNPSDAIIYNPEREKVLNKTAIENPPMPHLLPPELSKMFKTRERREENKDMLDFMRDKHILIYGSSLDREMVKMFCTDHEHTGEVYTMQHHRHVYCHFEDYNFTLTAAHHFGLHQSTWFWGDDVTSAGIHVEDRLEKVVKPLTERFGDPNLIIFSSGLWDLMYFHKLAKRKDPKYDDNMYRPVPYERLIWQRARLAEVMSTLQETYPGVPLLYRTTTQPAKTRGSKDDEMIAVFQLNQSAKALMQLLEIPIFHWSDLVKGSHEYKDMVHFTTESRQNWLYGEMLLYTLKAVSDPKVDTSCWLDRWTLHSSELGVLQGMRLGA